MSETSLENTLRDLPRFGTLVKDRGYRQVWRFEHGGKAYYLKFYRRGGGRDAWRRMCRGSPATLEFTRLQRLQKAGIPAARAVACLLGYALKDEKGDALIIEAIEPSITLDEYLADHELRGIDPPDHRQLADQVIELVYQLGKAKLGHDDLHLGNFLVRNGKVYLIDAWGIREGGLRSRDVLYLGASVGRFATTADLIRGWRKLAGGDKPPATNPLAPELAAEFMDRTTGDNRYFGRTDIGGWSGIFFRHTKHPRRWSRLSHLTVSDDDFRRAWERLLGQIESDSLQVLKRTRSGDVLATEMEIGDMTLPVIVKHPKRKFWWRYLNEFGRGPRPRRAWYKAWKLIGRNLPTAWPLAVMERKRLGYAVDSLIICEQVQGPTLWQTPLDDLPADDRERLFRRTGKLLRQLERHGLAHFDAKASNWIILPDELRGPTPVLIDVDGIRPSRAVAVGIERLLRSLKAKKDYTPEDSLRLCRGYAPFAPIGLENDPETASAERSNGQLDDSTK